MNRIRCVACKELYLMIYINPETGLCPRCEKDFGDFEPYIRRLWFKQVSWIGENMENLNCECGKPVPKRGGGAFFETHYCSRYCREFYTKGLERIPKKSSSKHHKNHFSYPEIDSECEGCGNQIKILPMKADKGRSQSWCSRSCLNALRKAPMRRPHLVFAMLSLLKHRRKYNIYGGWMDSHFVFTMMQRFNNSSGKNSYPSLLSIWTKKGVLESRKISSDSPTEYRISDWGLNNPLGKVIFEAKGIKWEE